MFSSEPIGKLNKRGLWQQGKEVWKFSFNKMMNFSHEQKTQKKQKYSENC